MDIILRSNKKRGDFYLLFGLKGLSVLENLVSLEELEKMDTSKIYIALDKNMFNSDLSFLEDALIKLDELKVKGIFFYDLSVLSLAKKLDLSVSVIWNQNFLVTNYKTCNFYNKEGVSGAVLASEITISEIEEIAKNTNMDLFVNVFGYQLMAISKRHLISSYFDYMYEDNDVLDNYITERSGKYKVLEREYGTKFLTKDILNGIRYINRLKSAGVNYIILDDYDIDEEVFSKVCDYFSTSVSGVSDTELINMERDINSMLPTSLGFFDKKTIYKVKVK